jgi:hypothetical protein
MALSEYLAMHSTAIDPWSFPTGCLTAVEKRVVLRSAEWIASGSAEWPTFVEVGTLYGFTSEAIARMLLTLRFGCDFYTIDKKNWGNARGQMSKVEDPVRAKALEGNSWDAVAEIPGDIAWCFIDACHCYDCAAKDIIAFAPRIGTAGLLLFHDTHPHPRRSGHGAINVAHAIADSKIMQKHFELVYEVPPVPERGKSKVKPWGGLRVYQRVY